MKKIINRLRLLSDQARELKKIALVIAIIAACLFNASCASVDISPEQTQFKTRITQTKLKHFKVQVRKTNTSLPAKLSDNPEVRRKQIQKLAPERLNKQLMQAAEFHIKQSKFCKDGFWVIETNSFNPVMLLRGECNDSASEQDKLDFPNTFEQW